MNRRTVFAALALIAALPALATVRAYAPHNLRQQWELAKHVALVRVTTVRKLGPVGNDRPLGPCGVLYGFEVLEQFKGELPHKAVFATHRILFPERPLHVKEEALIFLRDLRIRQSLDSGIQPELDAAADAIAKCGLGADASLCQIVDVSPRSSLASLGVRFETCSSPGLRNETAQRRKRPPPDEALDGCMPTSTAS